jgi:hypothetical protein
VIDEGVDLGEEVDWVMELFSPKTLELILSKTQKILPTEQGLREISIPSRALLSLMLFL